MVMFSILSWWYGAGLADQLRRIKKALLRMNDQFSVPLLLKTLFQPFRMIDADKVYGPSLDDKMKAWLDKMISCLIGGMIRTVVVVVGVIVLFLMVIFSGFRLVIWIILPVLPVVALIACIAVEALWI